MELSDVRPEIILPMARPLFSPPLPSELTEQPVIDEAVEIDTAALFDRIVVDRRRLLKNIENALRVRSQVTLEAIVADYPLEEGLAELIDYFSIAAGSTHASIHEDQNAVVTWRDRNGVTRRATVPKVVFVSRERS